MGLRWDDLLSKAEIEAQVYLELIAVGINVKEIKKAGLSLEDLLELNCNLHRLLDRQAIVKRDRNVHEYWTGSTFLLGWKNRPYINGYLEWKIQNLGWSRTCGRQLCRESPFRSFRQSRSTDFQKGNRIWRTGLRDICWPSKARSLFPHFYLDDMCAILLLGVTYEHETDMTAVCAQYAA